MTSSHDPFITELLDIIRLGAPSAAIATPLFPILLYVAVMCAFSGHRALKGR